MDRSVVDLLPVQVRKFHKDDQLYNESETFLIETPAGSTIIACPHNLTLSGNYFDSTTEKTYSWNGEVREEEEEFEPVSLLVKSLSAELNSKYVGRRFPQGVAGAFDGKDGSQSIYFVIYAHVDDTKNNRYGSIWCAHLNRFGRWIADWEYHIDSGALEGTVKVEYVCREDINMHFSQTLPYSAKADNPGGLEQKDLISFILRHVSKAGDQVQSTLVEQQEAFYNDHLKRLRRQLPVTRTKMDWNKYSSYQLKSELGSIGRGQ